MVVIKLPTEHDEQVTLIKRCDWNKKRFPALRLLYAIPNGGVRHVIVARKLKAEGVRAGVPDLCLPVPRGGKHGLYLEMKRTKGGEVSKAQKEWHEALRQEGYECAIAKGAEEAWSIIVEYLQQ